MDAPPLVLVVSPEDAGERLDRWLAARLPEHSRSQVQRWIRQGRVWVDGTSAKPAHRVEPGETVAVHIPPPEETALRPEAIPLTILYEDADLLVVDKPPGMVVHPGPGHPRGTLVQAVLHRCPDIQGVGGEKRPGIVHRLDKDTSGLILVAKNDRAHRYLQRQFAERKVHKEYLALVAGRPDPAAGRIVAPIGRHPVHRKRMAVLPRDPVTGQSRGREAITQYETLASYRLPRARGAAPPFTLVRAVPLTGRTHQIRVHLAWLGHPVVGDSVYGPRRPHLTGPRLFLHAHRLRLRLPSGLERAFVSPLPRDLRQLLEGLEPG